MERGVWPAAVCGAAELYVTERLNSNNNKLWFSKLKTL